MSDICCVYVSVSVSNPHQHPNIINSHFSDDLKIKKTTPSLNIKKINEVQKSLLNDMTSLTKKRAVTEGSIFTANMNDRMSFGSKVGQIFQNIKLNFWDVSKSIRQDCEKLSDLLLKQVESFIDNGTTDSPTKTLEGLDNKLTSILESSSKTSDKEISQHQQDLNKLAKQIKALTDLSKASDSLNSFSLPYGEQDVEYIFKGKQEKLENLDEDIIKKAIKKINVAKDSIDSVRGERIKGMKDKLKSRIEEAEKELLGSKIEEKFYERIDVEDDELINKCNKVAERMKKIKDVLEAINSEYANELKDIDSTSEEGRKFLASLLESEPAREDKIGEIRLKMIPKGVNKTVRMIGIIPYIGDKDRDKQNKIS